MQIDLNQLLLFGGVVVFSIFVLFIWKRLFLKHAPDHSCHEHCNHAGSTAPDSSELEAISGEDVHDTQLNLAKAYLEINNDALAKSLLQAVLKNGNVEQQLEAGKILEKL